MAAKERMGLSAPDIISWGNKAQSLLAFARETHNATWNSDVALIRVGSMSGRAILLSFAVECAVKALLESKGTKITKKLRKHNLYELFGELSPKTKETTSSVYRSLLMTDADNRIHSEETNSLNACLQNHDSAFVNWRYHIGRAGKFYPVAMIYACVSLLTFVFPDQKFMVGSLTSSVTEVLGGSARRVSSNP